MQPDLKTLLVGAHSLVKTAAAQQPAAKDMGLDMDSVSGLASDYLLGGTVGLNRAGRAKQLGRAMHRDIPGPLNHPSTSVFLQSVGGGLGGGALGGLAGYGLGSLDSKQSAGDGAVLGSTLGVGIGGLAGMLRSLYKRRQAMREVAKAYETGTPLDPEVKPHTGLLNTLLTPLGGPVRSGEADVYEATHGKYHGHQDRVTPDAARTNLNMTTEVGSRIAPLAYPPFALMTGMAQNLNARRRVNKVDAENKKQAAAPGMLQQLLDGGRSLVNKVDLKNPVHTGAIGAGVGALGGLAGSALSRDDEEEKSPLQAALLGGGLGGAAGAGVGMLNQHMSPQLPHIPQVGTPAQPRAATMA